MIDFSIEQQILVSLIIFFIGLSAGVFFDLIRAMVKTFQLGTKILFIADILFSLAVTVVVFQVLFNLHWGEVRVYILIFFFLGIVLYYFFISRYLYRVFYKFFNKCLNIIIKIFSIWKVLQNKSRIIINWAILRLKNIFRKGK